MYFSKSNDAQYLYFVKNKRFPLDLYNQKKKKKREKKEELSSLFKKMENVKSHK
jgi:hypothetical protein